MESKGAVVSLSESPNANAKANEEAKNIVGNGEAKNDNKKPPVVVALTVVAPADITADRLGKLALVTSSSAKTESPKDVKKKKMTTMEEKSNIIIIHNNSNTNKKKVQVSNSKKPFIFYLNLAKRCISRYGEVELCGLGMAIPTVITIAEVLKRHGFAIQKEVKTSTVLRPGEGKKGHWIEKAEIKIVLGKADKVGQTNGSVTPKICC